MEWTEEHDNCLCQEILVFEPKKEAFLEARSGKKTCKQSERPLIRSVSVLLEREIHTAEREI